MDPARTLVFRPLAVLVFLFTVSVLAAQNDTVAADTTHLDWRARHSPRTATILSAVLPGAGQVYNRKYWKVPIVLGGMGAAIYFVDRNATEYERYKRAYLAVTDTDPNTVDEFNGAYSSTSLLSVADTYRKWRDLSWICIGAVYVLNIVDATVDAHFVRFDAGEDLSLSIGPGFGLAAQGAVGATLQLTF